VPRAVYLFANGAEGDVSPAWPPRAAATSRHRPATRARRTIHPVPLEWRSPPRRTSPLVGTPRERRSPRSGRVWGRRGRVIRRAWVALTDRLELGRAFATLALRDSARALGICSEPALGLSTLVGADDAHTRIQGGAIRLFDVGLKQGSPNPDVPGCQAQKRNSLTQRSVASPTSLISGSLPSSAQVTVLRLGSRVIGAVPAEVTTTAGRRMREQMLASAREAGLPVSTALILGHANGYMEYSPRPRSIRRSTTKAARRFTARRSGDVRAHAGPSRGVRIGRR